MKTAYGMFIDSKLRKTALDLWHDQKYFTIKEIVPEKIYQERKENCIELFRPEAILTLIEVRILAESPITVNTWAITKGGFQFRGYRPPYYYLGKLLKSYKEKELDLNGLFNQVSNFHEYSQHTFFNAFDYNVNGYTADEFRKMLINWKREGKLPHLTGIEQGVPWVHMDCRLSNRLDADGLFLFNE